eukprot:13729607-Alexandrium_andersonii.AAC.1
MPSRRSRGVASSGLARSAPAWSTPTRAHGSCLDGGCTCAQRIAHSDTAPLGSLNYSTGGGGTPRMR